MGRPNLFREIKFAGTNRDREKYVFPVQLTTSDWESDPVDIYSSVSNARTYIIPKFMLILLNYHII